MEITIKEIENSIKNVFKDSDVLNTETVYEQIDDSENLKLIIFINKMFGEKTNILYTKIIFTVDSGKIKLTNNSFLYLYDINCKYTNVDFSDLYEFEKKMNKIFEKGIFGNDLKFLSDFIEKPAIIINDWFSTHLIKNINVMSIKYNPDMYIMPCKSLHFSFTINVNNIDVNFTLTKENNKNYIFTFIINDETVTINKSNLKNIDDTIGTILKNKLK
jgi:hypothetical protein